MSDELPPIWALDKAAAATELYRNWKEVHEVSWSRPGVIAHARTIAKHEQAPDDQDEEALARILNAWAGGTPRTIERLKLGARLWGAALEQFKRELEARQ